MTLKCSKLELVLIHVLFEGKEKFLEPQNSASEDSHINRMLEH
jgi:hypothetical protein